MGGVTPAFPFGKIPFLSLNEVHLSYCSFLFPSIQGLSAGGPVFQLQAILISFPQKNKVRLIYEIQEQTSDP